MSPFLNKGRYAHRFSGIRLLIDYEESVPLSDPLCVKHLLDIALPTWEGTVVPGGWRITHQSDIKEITGSLLLMITNLHTSCGLGRTVKPKKLWRLGGAYVYFDRFWSKKESAIAVISLHILGFPLDLLDSLCVWINILVKNRSISLFYSHRTTCFFDNQIRLLC